MVTVRSIDGKLITSENYTELLKAVKDELAILDGFSPKVEFLTHTSAIIYINEIPAEEPEPEPWRERKCCECDNYEWGSGCPYRNGHVTIMMPACEHFYIEYGEVQK